VTREELQVGLTVRWQRRGGFRSKGLVFAVPPLGRIGVLIPGNKVSIHYVKPENLDWGGRGKYVSVTEQGVR
jgi:hypothetical protein